MNNDPRHNTSPHRQTSSESSPSIQCRGIEVEFSNAGVRSTVLSALDLDVVRGQIVSLLGASGCGKSTLLRVVAGLINPTRGTVLVDGETPLVARDRMSFVFQEAALLPWRTVWQNVLLPLELRGTARESDSRDTVSRLLNTVGFSSADRNKLPSQLSGGMKMRASIARALVTDPSILLLDEPFAALDDMLRSKLNDLLLSIAEDGKRSILFVTHNIAEAIYLSHSISIMNRGSIAQKVSVPLEFPREPRLRSTPEFAEFYGFVSELLVERSA